ncbi:MAG: histone deacetylase family protein, partial [bacterium]
MSIALVTHPDYVKHQTGPGHPERPERMRAVTAAIEESGLQEHVAQMTAEPVDAAVLEHVHHRSH